MGINPYIDMDTDVEIEIDTNVDVSIVLDTNENWDVLLNPLVLIRMRSNAFKCV